jgi:large subunit ribosomal protein L4
VYDLKGEVVDNIQLDPALFDGKVNKTLLWEANKMYEARKRSGTASAKTRSEVRGGGQKPWRQKGTGRARVGSTRNPIWKHGGVAFPPKPRDYGYSMPKKALRKALLSSMNARLLEQNLKATVKLEVKEPKTKYFEDILSKLGVTASALIVVDGLTDEIKRASRNIKRITVKGPGSVNARDILLKDMLLIEKDAFTKVVERLK